MRIEGWSTKFLSQGGKEVFIKSVLQAIPTFTMSCFLLSISLCRMMESIFAKFWWQKGKGRKGGLGFRNMAQFNVAILAKQGWRFLENPNSLISQLGNKNSYVWRSIWAAKGILEKGLIWKVGTGMNISIGNDAWVPDLVNSRLLFTYKGSNESKVAELINSQIREWNREVIDYTFGADEAEKIICIPLAKIPPDDLLAWSSESSGGFSVKSTYKLLQSFDPRAYAVQNIYNEFYRKLWSIDLPTKIKITTWKVSWNYLPTRANLLCKKLIADASCPRCGSETETVNHLYRDCPISVEVWSHLPDVNFLQCATLDFEQWLTKTFDLLPLDLCKPFVVLYGPSRGDRNAWIHEKISKTGKEIANFVKNYIKELDDVKNKSTKLPKVAVKINFDGAFDKEKHQSASGIVARDSEGKVLVSKSTIHEKVAFAFAAEAIACRGAL
ncbi:reverse transcriptase [Gossypium australe]|uniref:Reverse transcriptase n=1 Tax=Gossypium australe TaxID=47621 RepID=A0A5B6W0V5_9ROSI|nr:reverse transcriptase [Gossypium australe]